MQNDNEANSAWGSLVLLGGAAGLQEAPRVGFRSAADVRETNSIKRPLIPVASRASASEDSRRGEKVSLASSCKRRSRSQSEIIYVPAATPAMLLRLRLTKNTSAREEMSSHLKVLTVYQHRGNYTDNNVNKVSRSV